MNPLTVMKMGFGFVLEYWWLLLIIGLGATVLWYRAELADANGQIAVFKEREAAQVREQQARELANIRNKERVDEEFTAARKRAATVVVRSNKPSTIVASKAPAPTSGGRAGSCVSRGDIDIVVADFSRQHAQGLTDVHAEVSRRHSIELTNAAREFEKLAAAYRSCRSFAIDSQ